MRQFSSFPFSLGPAFVAQFQASLRTWSRFKNFDQSFKFRKKRGFPALDTCQIERRIQIFFTLTLTNGQSQGQNRQRWPWQCHLASVSILWSNVQNCKFALLNPSTDMREFIVIAKKTFFSALRLISVRHALQTQAFRFQHSPATEKKKHSFFYRTCFWRPFKKE